MRSCRAALTAGDQLLVVEEECEQTSHKNQEHLFEWQPIQ